PEHHVGGGADGGAAAADGQVGEIDDRVVGHGALGGEFPAIRKTRAGERGDVVVEDAELKGGADRPGEAGVIRGAEDEDVDLLAGETEAVRTTRGDLVAEVPVRPRVAV